MFSFCWFESDIEAICQRMLVARLVLINVKKACVEIAALLQFFGLVRLEEATSESSFLDLASYFQSYPVGFRHKMGAHPPPSLFCCMECYFSLGFPEGT